MTLFIDLPHTVYREVAIPAPEVLVIQSDLEKALLHMVQSSFEVPMEVRRCITLFAPYK